MYADLDALSECDNLKYVYVLDGEVDYYTDSLQRYLHKDCLVLRTLK